MNHRLGQVCVEDGEQIMVIFNHYAENSFGASE
jgi:hypothetical protein